MRPLSFIWLLHGYPKLNQPVALQGFMEHWNVFNCLPDLHEKAGGSHNGINNLIPNLADQWLAPKLYVNGTLLVFFACTSASTF